MYNALSVDKTKNDFKEIKREIRSISEKLKSQMTSPRGEEGYIDLVYTAISKKVGPVIHDA